MYLILLCRLRKLNFPSIQRKSASIMPELQLMMRRPNLEGLYEVDLPPSYRIRTYQHGDEEAWVDIMNESLGSGWTVSKCQKSLIRRPQFEPEGLLFITHKGSSVGTACAWREAVAEKEIGYVHMVGILKAHRGKRLGKGLVLKVLQYLKERGLKEARLLTDDFRLPAIKTYLNAGMEPVFREESHRGRWANVYRSLGLEAQAAALCQERYDA